MTLLLFIVRAPGLRKPCANINLVASLFEAGLKINKPTSGTSMVVWVAPGP